MDTPHRPQSGDLRADLDRLEREIEELRVRIAQEAAAWDGRRRSRRLSRTSRAESAVTSMRTIAPVTSLEAARVRRATPATDDDGPQAA